MLIKELRGTESTQDACAKMRVWQVSPIPEDKLIDIVCVSGNWPVLLIFPLEVNRANEKSPDYRPLNHIQGCEVYRRSQQG